jgi:hypothetical protein
LIQPDGNVERLRLPIHLGVSPLSWTNAVLAELGGDIPLEVCLKDAAENGYAGVELGRKVYRMRDQKRDRGFTTIYCGSQVPQYAAFFGFDFAGGGLGYFDIKLRSPRPGAGDWPGRKVFP